MNIQQTGQQRIGMAPLPMKAGVIDVEGLERGVTHLGKGLAHAVRWSAPIPGNLKPEVSTQPLAVQIATLWKAYATFSGRIKSKADDRETVARFRALTRIYDDINRSGCKLTQADGLKERHVRILLDLWKREGKSVATIRKDWSILKVWGLALGKPGMVGRLEEYWPDVPKGDTTPKSGTSGKTEAGPLTSPQMTELLRASDQTHWHTERLVQKLGVTVEEALLFDKDMAANYLAGKLVMRSAARREYRSIPLADHDSVILVQEVQSFIQSKGRARLMWRDMTPAEAVRKHQNRIAYLRRKFPAITPVNSGQGAGHD